MGIADIYKKSEDVYYDVLDRTNQYVPVYKVIEPLDRVVPSFAVLLLILLALVLGLLVLPFLSDYFEPAKFAVLHTTDDEGKTLAGVKLTLAFPTESRSFISPEDGKVFVPLSLPAVTARVTAEKRGYKTVEKELVLKDGETVPLALSALGEGPIDLEGETIELYVADVRTGARIQNTMLHLSFSCSEGIAPPDMDVLSEPQPILVEKPARCGLFSVQVSAEGYKTSPSVLLEGEFRFIFLEALDEERKTGALTVWVHDKTGKPVEGAFVDVIEPPSFVVRTGESDESGSVGFFELEPGTYRVTVLALDGQSVVVEDVAVVSGETTAVEVLLSPKKGSFGDVLLRVVDAVSEEPVEGAILRLFMGDAAIGPPFTLGEDGLLQKTLQFSTASPSLHAKVTAEGYLEKIFEISVKESGDLPDVLRLERKQIEPPKPEDRGEVLIRVHNEQDGPLEGATVTLTDELGRGMVGVTEADGTHLFTDVPPGTYTAWARDTKGREGEGMVQVEPDTSSRITHTIDTSQKVTQTDQREIRVFVVEDGTGQAVENADVTLYHASSVLGQKNTGADGQATFLFIEGHFTPAFSVRVEAEGFLTAQTSVDAHTLDANEVNIIRLQPVSPDVQTILTVQTLDPSGRPIAQLQVAIYLEGESSPIEEQFSSLDGHVVFGPLPAGSYTARTRLGDRVFSAPSVELAEGEEKTVQLIVDMGEGPCAGQICGNLSITVLDAQAQPAMGAEVRLFLLLDEPLPVGKPGARFFTNEAGKHLFEYLETGAYLVQVQRDDFEAEGVVEVVGHETIPFTLTMARSFGTLEARVLVADGDVLRGEEGVEIIVYGDDAGSEIGRCTTLIDGNCLLEEVPAGLSLRVEASKEGFLPQHVGGVRVQAHDLLRVELLLNREADIEGLLGVLFSGICEDAACKRTLGRVVSDPVEPRQYWLRFHVLAGKSFDTMSFHFRVEGPDSRLPETGYTWRIEDAFAPFVPHHYFNQCSNPEDVFSLDPVACQSTQAPFNAQRVRIDGELVEVGSYTFLVLVEIEPGLADGVELQGVAQLRGTNVEEELFSKEFELSLHTGKLVCAGNALAWGFSLEGENVNKQLVPSNVLPVALEPNSDYSLHYKMAACSLSPSTPYSLVVSNQNPPGVLDFADAPGPKPVELFSARTFSPGEIIEEGSPAGFTTQKTASSTQVLFSLFQDTSGSVIISPEDEQILNFSVIPDQNLAFVGVSEDYPPIANIEVEGQVVDTAGDSVGSAVLRLFVNEELRAESVGDEEGHFVVTHQLERALTTEDELVLLAIKPGYMPLEKSIVVRPIRREVGLLTRCLSASFSLDGEGALEVLQTGQAKEHWLENTCEKPLSIKLDPSHPDVTVSPTDFSLSAGSRQAFSVLGRGQESLGYREVLIRAAASTDDVAAVQGVLAFAVEDEDACFSLSTYRYDLRAGKAEGVLHNACFTENMFMAIPSLKLFAHPFVALQSRYGAPVQSELEVKVTGQALLLQDGKEIKRSWEIQARNMQALVDDKRPVALLFSLQLEDIIFGSPEKGIEGIMEKNSETFVGLLDLDVTVSAVGEDGKIWNAWYEGENVYALPQAKGKQSPYGFILQNRSLQYSQQSHLSVRDAVK